MKLCRKSRDELRKEVIEQLQKVPMGKRIRLKKETLEKLLFEEIKLNKEGTKKVKVPVWSGSFLRKIDLNEIEFDDVSWSFLSDEHDDLSIFKDEEIFEYAGEQIETIKKAYSKGYRNLDYGYTVDYSKTNANIDLASSYEAKYEKKIVLKRCNFSGVDFFCQDFIGVEDLIIFLSDLSDTKISIPNDINIRAYRTDFTGADLSERTIDATSFFPEDEHYTFGHCNLNNTNININLNSESIKENGLEDLMKKTMEESWIGCYVNGIKIIKPEERRIRAQKKKEEYENMKESILNEIKNSINDQIKEMKKTKE